MRFHLCGLPHTVASKRFCSCAYTQKHLNMAKMMRSLGHQVIDYSAEGSEADADEHVSVITAEEQERFFGGGNWHERAFTVSYDPSMPYWRLANYRTAQGIRERQQQGDFVLLIAGTTQRSIADQVGGALALTVEYGVGYYGTFALYRVFESYTHQACVYGQQSPDPDGRLYDAVIPNSFDPADFPFHDEKSGYLLYLARSTRRKGIAIAIETARAAEMPLIIAGAGARCENGRLETDDGLAIELPPGASYLGPAGAVQRARLMGRARALIQPTLYMEPFGGNVAEAALCGTPAITTDYAAFSETVLQGVTGYRCRTLDQFVRAAELVGSLEPREIHERAVERYSLDRVKWLYQEYFEQLTDLWGEGWPTLTRRRPRELPWDAPSIEP
jgi:glycosyltransferase involved in cell wall biosynthesis